MKDYIYFQNSLTTLIFFLCIFCFIFLIKNLYLIVFHFFEGKFIFGLTKQISSNLYKQYIFKDYFKLVKENSSKLITKLTNELAIVQSYFISFFNILSEGIIFFLITIFLVMLYSVKIIYIIIFLIILLTIFFLLFYNKIKTLGIERKILKSKIKKIYETSGGIKDIKILGLENLFYLKYYEYTNSISKFLYKYYTIQKILDYI